MYLQVDQSVVRILVVLERGVVNQHIDRSLSNFGSFFSRILRYS